MGRWATRRLLTGSKSNVSKRYEDVGATRRLWHIIAPTPADVAALHANAAWHIVKEAKVAVEALVGRVI
jgi:hypothetical protein